MFLFSGDIAYNIMLGNRAIDEEKMKDISRYINAAKFIERLPAGYAEKVGERGKTLSVGERQLLSFARALVYEPKILVLDEATSALDTETERDIQESLAQMGEGRSVITIAHRLSTIVDADTILVMENGRVIEQGTHHALLQSAGHYAGMWELQQQEEAQERETAA